MNRKMRKFYNKITKMENMGVVFTKYNGKIIISEDPENINIPEGYSIINNEVFLGDEKIGEIEVFKRDNDEIDLDNIDLDELSDDTIDYTDDTIDYTKEENNKAEKEDINSEETVEKTKKAGLFTKIGYSIKKAFTPDTDYSDFDLDEDTMDEVSVDNEVDLDNDAVIDSEVDNKNVEAKPRKNIFRRFVQTIGFGINKFFDYFGKKNDVDVTEDVLDEEKENINKPKDVEEIVDESKEENNDDNYDELSLKGEKLSDLEKYIRYIDSIIEENKDINLDFYKDRLNNYRNEFSDLYNRFVNNEAVSIEELDELNNKLMLLNNELNVYIKDNINNTDGPIVINKETKSEDKKEETKSEDKKDNNRSFKFVSIEDTKAKFEEYDKPEIEFKEIEEKIAYYEEFLKTHDLSHSEDQGMKERMEAKLATLKERYNEIMESKKDKNAENNLRTEKMAFYTQTAMGIDKAIENNEIERQIRLLRFKQDPNAIELDAEETRGFYTRKEELEALKAECLARKAEVNKYYEEQADIMTKALKR